jgi:hypothetical protein
VGLDVSVPFTARLILPAAAEMRTGRTVTGATLAGLGGAANTLAGVYARHWQVVHGTQVVESAAARRHGYVHATDGVNQALDALITVGPLDSALQVAVLTAAQEAGGSSSPIVTVRLDNITSTVIDIGVTWSRALGTLACRELPEVRLPATASLRRIVPTWQTTGDVRRPDLATAGSASGPRALEANTSTGDVRGSVAVLRVTSTSCRILAVAVLPVWGTAL